MNVRRCLATTLLCLLTTLSACGQTITNLQDTRRRLGSPPAKRCLRARR